MPNSEASTKIKAAVVKNGFLNLLGITTGQEYLVAIPLSDIAEYGFYDWTEEYYDYLYKNKVTNEAHIELCVDQFRAIVGESSFQIAIKGNRNRYFEEIVNYDPKNDLSWLYYSKENARIILTALLDGNSSFDEYLNMLI